MTDPLFDLFFLAVFAGSMLAIAGVGILALPWKDDELDETTRAVRAGSIWIDATLRNPGPDHPPMGRGTSRRAA